MSSYEFLHPDAYGTNMQSQMNALCTDSLINIILGL